MVTLIKNIAALVARKLYYTAGWIRASLHGVKLASTARVSPFADVKGAAYLGEVVVGREVRIGKGTYVNSGDVSAATIGDYCSIAYNVLIGPTEHLPDHWTTSPYEAVTAGFPAASTTREVPPPVIEDRVWLGAHVVVLRGVRIGAGAIVAAGAVVTRDIPAGEIWGGVPAKFLRKRRSAEAPAQAASAPAAGGR